MLQIHHAEDDAALDPRSPSKLYADACWQADPRLSPDWWREAQGYTFGKLALDWRQDVFQPEHLATGCNLVLASPQTLDAAYRVIANQSMPEAVVGVVVSPSPLPPVTAPQPPTFPFFVWQPQNPTPEERQSTLIYLENMVKNGEIEAYGIVPDAMPLHLWLEAAAEAAATANNRRKRPALRLLVTPFDLLDMSLLTHSNTMHKTESVSTLELAARLGLTVIAINPTLPEDVDISDALQYLMQVAEAENTLNQSLGGWPQIHGQQLFSVLAHLGHGQTPWPTLHHWHNWREHVWPTLRNHWQSLPGNSHISKYSQTLEAILPHGETLARASAQPALYQALEHLKSGFPEAWHNQSASAQTLGLLTSIPGLTAVAPSRPFDPKPLQHLPNLPDVGALLLA